MATDYRPLAGQGDGSGSRMAIAWRQWLPIALILTMTAVYHAATIHRQCLFGDEIRELAITRWPLIEAIFARDSAPPLFPSLNRAWLAVWGDDAAARWFSALVGMTGIAALWAFTRRLVDQKTADWSATLYAICPLQLFYAQFVRCYALMTLLAILTVGSFAIAKRGERKAWPAFVASAVTGMYTHYYFAILLLCLALILPASRHYLRDGLLAFVTTAIFSAPVAIFLKEDFGFQKHLRDARPMSVAAVGYTGLSFFSGYALGPSKSELHTVSTSEAAREAAPWAAAVAVFSAPLAVAGLRRLWPLGLAAPLVAVIVLPILITGGLGAVAGITYNVRFVAWCVAPLMVLLGAGAAVRAWPQRLGAIGVAAIMVIALVNRNGNPRYFNEEFRDAAAYLQSNAADGAPVFCVSGYTAGMLAYYLRDGRPILELPTPGVSGEVVRSTSQVENAKQVARTTTRGEAWLLYCRAFHGDPDGLLLSAMQSDFDLEEAERFPGVVLYRTESVEGGQAAGPQSAVEPTP